VLYPSAYEDPWAAGLVHAPGGFDSLLSPARRTEFPSLHASLTRLVLGFFTYLFF